MSFAFDEIMSQPETWATTLEVTPGQCDQIAGQLGLAPESQLLFIGCGTSYYLAQTASAIFQEVTGRVARAAPGSEVFLSPESILPREKPLLAFVISRSGTSSEAVMAARFLREQFPVARTVGITCTPGSDLVAATDHTIELPHADDRSVVMTRSFTNMLLALQIVATRLAGADGHFAELQTLPELMHELLDDSLAFARTLATRTELRRFIYLGLGPNYGLAAEATLKLKEMTQVECESYNPLEFRHGAISIVREGTAVVLLANERERAYLPDVEADLKRHGACVAAVAPYAPAHADLVLRLPGDLSDLTRSVLYLPAVQLLAHERAVMLGLDPDAPRNLSHVVVLDGR